MTEEELKAAAEHWKETTDFAYEAPIRELSAGYLTAIAERDEAKSNLASALTDLAGAADEISVLEAERDEARGEIAAFRNHLSEALNSGDGTYKP